MTFWQLFKTGFAAGLGACTALLLMGVVSSTVFMYLFYVLLSPLSHG